MKIYNLIKITLAVLLLLCLFKMPIAYYNFVRSAALIGFTLLAYKAYEDEQKYTIALYITLATIFQPIIKLQMEKPTWNKLDVIVAIWLLGSVWIYKKSHGNLG